MSPVLDQITPCSIENSWIFCMNRGSGTKRVKFTSIHAGRFPDRSTKTGLLFILHPLPSIRKEIGPPKRNKEETFKTRIGRFLTFTARNRGHKNAVNKNLAICSNSAGKCYPVHLPVNLSPSEKWVCGRASLTCVPGRNNRS